MLHSGRSGFVGGAGFCGGWGVEGEIETDVFNLDANDPRDEVTFWLVWGSGWFGDLIAAGAHQLQNAGQVHMHPVLGHISRSADVCTAEAIQRVSIVRLMQSLAELSSPDGRAWCIGGDHASTTEIGRGCSKRFAASNQASKLDEETTKKVNGPVSVATVTRNKFMWPSVDDTTSATIAICF